MAINMQRRKAVMSRSMKLGHCVCDPRKPCPCDVFKEHNVCHCAGEKMPVKTGAVALTKHVRKAGCASKIGQADLLRILGNLPPVEDPRVLVGAAAGDDAGIYKLDDERALVQTVDVFAPCVDDPFRFGQIAAANSVSDVYAMGGTPLTALSVVGFPIDDLDGAIMETMLRGAMEKLEEANCALIGGHSINDVEIKLGFAVTGVMHPAAAVQRNRAEAGDVLVLTKPLGTGMISFASQIGRVDEDAAEAVGLSMATLNRDAAELMNEHGVHACTDVTGFGLAGHLVEMVRGSGVSVELELSQLPVFAAVPDCLKEGILSGAIERNQEYAMAWIQAEDGMEERLPILYDPQTSGGLLVALRPQAAEAYVSDMRSRGHEATSIIGKVIEKPADSDGQVVVHDGEFAHCIGEGKVLGKEEASVPAPPPAKVVASTPSAPAGPDDDEPCCANPPSFGDNEDPVDIRAQTSEAFGNFIKAANQPGLIDARTKKLMAITLSIANRCQPCLELHVRAALKMGISKEEIDEAAQLAVAFGSGTAMMFYKTSLNDMRNG